MSLLLCTVLWMSAEWQWEILAAYCKVFEPATPNRGPLFLPAMSPVSRFFPLICHPSCAAKKTARRQGVGAVVITGRKGREEGREGRAIARVRRGEAVCNNCAIEGELRKVQSDGFHLLRCGRSESSGVVLDGLKFWITVEKEHHI